MEIEKFNALFHLYYTPLCIRINLLVQDKELAEDLVQDAFVKFWETNPALQDANAAPAYVARMAVNNALMHLRANKQKKNVEEFLARQSQANNPTEEKIHYQESEQRLEATLIKLPPACREVFILSRYEQMSYQEIATHQGISVKTVENHILKALKILRESLLALALLLIS